MLRSVGEAPEQYPDYDDDDDDDDDDESVIDHNFRPQKINYNETGYVIREHDLFSGRTYYKGKNDYSGTKSGISMRDTYTLKGAKIAVSTMLTNSGNSDTTQYSIERLDECYPESSENDSQFDTDLKHAMKRLDELIDGNDFNNGDKMRINEVRRVLQSFAADLTKKK